MQSTHTRRTNTHSDENQNQEANNTLRLLNGPAPPPPSATSLCGSVCIETVVSKLSRCGIEFFLIISGKQPWVSESCFWHYYFWQNFLSISSLFGSWVRFVEIIKNKTFTKRIYSFQRYSEKWYRDVSIGYLWQVVCHMRLIELSIKGRYIDISHFHERFCILYT